MLRRVLATCGNADCGRLGHGAKQSSVEIPQVVRALLDLQVHSASAGGAHTAVSQVSSFIGPHLHMVLA